MADPRAQEGARTLRPRPALTRERALRAAVALADAEGIAAVTMRRLAQAVGVEAMSLYHHVTGKEDLLDGMVDLVFAEVDLPAGQVDWRPAMRARSTSLREALVRHRWAIGLMDSRSRPGPATLRHHDAVVGCFRAAGLSVAMAAHAFSVVDSYVYGFVLQEVNLPFAEGDDLVPLVDQMLPDATTYPHLAELAAELVLQPGYRYADEFAYGLELVLDGVERAAAADRPRPRRRPRAGR